MNDENTGSAGQAGLGRRDVLIAGVAAGVASMGATQARAQESDPARQIPFGMPTPGRGFTLQGKVAVITGAARGIGRAIAYEMAANGADIVAIDICGPVSPASNAKPATPDELAETAKTIEASGRKCMTIQADIRDIGALRAAADRVEKSFGKIDIVVANAAIQRWKPLLEMDDADWRDIIENNLNGTANTVRAFAPAMVKREQGRFILFSSMQGKHGTKDGSSYSASKWGIIGLMKSAAMEFGKHKITVNALLPGLVDTPLTRYEARYRESMSETEANPPENPTPEQAWDARKARVPLKVGWLQPSDLGPAAVFLASDGAAMVTGAEYEVTAGDSAHDI
jgi:NAD(P)-dependent dehydrogenase (short-subunit alcohol dehydrogenase family)